MKRSKQKSMRAEATETEGQEECGSITGYSDTCSDGGGNGDTVHVAPESGQNEQRRRRLVDGRKSSGLGFSLVKRQQHNHVHIFRQRQLFNKLVGLRVKLNSVMRLANLIPQWDDLGHWEKRQTRKASSDNGTTANVNPTTKAAKNVSLKIATEVFLLLRSLQILLLRQSSVATAAATIDKADTNEVPEEWKAFECFQQIGRHSGGVRKVTTGRADGFSENDKSNDGSAISAAGDIYGGNVWAERRRKWAEHWHSTWPRTTDTGNMKNSSSVRKEVTAIWSLQVGKDSEDSTSGSIRLWKFADWLFARKVKPVCLANIDAWHAHTTNETYRGLESFQQNLSTQLRHAMSTQNRKLLQRIIRSSHVPAASAASILRTKIDDRNELIDENRGMRKKRRCAVVGCDDVVDLLASKQLRSRQGIESTDSNVLIHHANIDDTDFYVELLKQLGSTDGSVGSDILRREKSLLKDRKKSNRCVDRRASKGRKIRYITIPQLQNFMTSERWIPDVDALPGIDDPVVLEGLMSNLFKG